MGCLSLMHYTELSDSKGLVLMVGEYDKDSLGEGEATLLAVQTLQYYGAPGEANGPNSKKLNHLIRFSENIDEFNHLDLIAELEWDYPVAVQIDKERDGGEVFSRPSGTLLQSSKPHQVTVDAELSCSAGHV